MMVVNNSVVILDLNLRSGVLNVSTHGDMRPV
jgi:hypothetical protein